MTFGINLRKQRTGADVSLLAYQISALLTVPYVVVVSGYLYLVTHRGLLADLFDLGLSALPRWEALGLSWVYRRTSSEVIAYFIMLGLALGAGLLGRLLLRGSRETGLRTRVVMAVLLAADLVVRLLPLSFNGAFGTVCAVLGFVVRLACLVLVVLDLRADRRARREKAEGEQS